MQIHELSAIDIAHGVRTGELSAVEVTQAILDRIAKTDPNIQAWETVDAEGALAQARAIEARRRVRLPLDLPLIGVPVGIKDIFNVRGVPTTANFTPYRNNVAAEDSGAVEHFREAGAIIVGKTVTVQFATGLDSPKTRNPWDPDRTPGGSSSGSAAAVGARQVPVAIGTQTGGSVLRPAAYCGAVAIKPTFGRISRYGLLPVSWSFDQPGIITRSVHDAALVLQALARHDPRDPYSVRQERENFLDPAISSGSAPRLGLLVELLDRAEPSVRHATEAAVARLTNAGAQVREIRLPVPMDLLLGVHYLIRASEAAAVHAEQYDSLAEHYEPNLAANIELGRLFPASLYVHATRLRRRLRAQMAELVSGVDAIIAPTASNLPPLRSTGTGEPSFQVIWSLFGFPNVTIPTGLSPERLPHAIQVVGSAFRERFLFRVAAWCESVFEALPSPM